MNKWLKLVLLGILIWLIPFILSWFVWDVEANAPSVSFGLFNAIMAFGWSIGFAIALVVYFKGMKKNQYKEGLTAGITWYIVLVAMDLIVLVGALGMALSDWYYMFLTYLNTLLLTVVVGKLLSKS